MQRFTVRPNVDAISRMTEEQRAEHWYQCNGVRYAATAEEIAARINQFGDTFDSEEKANRQCAQFYNLRAPFNIARILPIVD